MKADGNSSNFASIPYSFVEVSEIRKIDRLLLATRAPYDSSGVYVKTDIEKSLFTVLRRTKRGFLFHYPAYKIIRQFDSKGLHDRVANRVWRGHIYHGLWQAALFIKWVFALLSKTGK